MILNVVVRNREILWVKYVVNFNFLFKMKEGRYYRIYGKCEYFCIVNLCLFCLFFYVFYCLIYIKRNEIIILLFFFRFKV